MRITNGMMTKNMIRNINNNLNRLSNLQEQSSTGKAVKNPSDDPVAATRILKLNSYLSDVEQMQENADDAASWMKFSESAIDEIDENIDRMRELTVEASNETYSEDDLNAVNSEIEQLMNSILDTANSSYAGRYVFAGYSTDEAPFKTASTDVGEKVMYNGKYLSLGGPVSGSISDQDYIDFYLENMDKVSGQPELVSSVYSTFTAASPDLDFDITLDGVTQTISLTDGTSYDIDTLQTELQAKISTAFPSSTGEVDPLVKVSTDDGKIILTVQSGESIQLNSGTLDIKNLGFSDGVSSTKGESEEIEYRLGKSNNVIVNVEGNKMVGEGEDSLFNTLAKLKLALDGETTYKTATYDEGPPAGVTVEEHDLDLSSILDDIDTDLSRLSRARSDLGARASYVELTKNRLKENYTSFTELLSSSEDTDYAEVTLKLSSAETIYNASLSAGADVIQLSLLDFLK